MFLSKLLALMVWAIKQFNANLNWACFVVKMWSVKGEQQNVFLIPFHVHHYEKYVMLKSQFWSQ